MSRVYIMCLFTYIFIGVCSNVSEYYRTDIEYANRTCLSSSFGFQRPSDSVLSCLYLCMWHDDCSGVVFQSSNNSCNGLRTDHDITECYTELAGAEYFHKSRIIYQWVERVLNFSSETAQYGYTAIKIVGPPDCYHGKQCDTSWSATMVTDSAFIEVAFAKAVYITGVDVFEANEPGLTTRICAKDNKGGEHVLFENTTVSVYHLDTRIFSPEIRMTDFKSSVLRVYVDTSSMYMTYIDAIYLHGKPW